jgi:hypothetical protein
MHDLCIRDAAKNGPSGRHTHFGGSSMLRLNPIAASLAALFVLGSTAACGSGAPTGGTGGTGAAAGPGGTGGGGGADVACSQPTPYCFSECAHDPILQATCSSQRTWTCPSGQQMSYWCPGTGGTIGTGGSGGGGTGGLGGAAGGTGGGAGESDGGGGMAAGGTGGSGSGSGGSAGTGGAAAGGSCSNCAASSGMSLPTCSGSVSAGTVCSATQACCSGNQEWRCGNCVAETCTWGLYCP